MQHAQQSHISNRGHSAVFDPIAHLTGDLRALVRFSLGRGLLGTRRPERMGTARSPAIGAAFRAERHCPDVGEVYSHIPARFDVISIFVYAPVATSGGAASGSGRTPRRDRSKFRIRPIKKHPCGCFLLAVYPVKSVHYFFEGIQSRGVVWFGRYFGHNLHVGDRVVFVYDNHRPGEESQLFY